MLRRRKRSLRERPALPGAVTTTRRRPRPGVQVPSELIVKEQPLVTERQTEAEPARARERKQKAVLVTGFDAFCGEEVNPSWQVCERLPREIGGVRIETCRVPCEFGRAIAVVSEAIRRVRPSLVICLGQAGGRTHLGVERLAINVDDARIPDNAGAQPIDAPVVEGGPAAYLATLPIKAMVAAMHAAGVPAEVSNSAGTYVCNHLMYGVLHYLATHGGEARAGFVHVPYAESQVIGKPAVAAMSLETMVKGVQAAIVAAHRHREDIRAGGGTLD